ncbi:hypothetical protein QQZ08_000613 [Neonectria magnoliae]|uniref:Uncharacterized protein n=1 Tax=Neonectria magnoliae TaxID=2732573 RepID=A0ABR1IIW7_9HYPO
MASSGQAEASEKHQEEAIGPGANISKTNKWLPMTEPAPLTIQGAAAPNNLEAIASQLTKITEMLVELTAKVDQNKLPRRSPIPSLSRGGGNLQSSRSRGSETNDQRAIDDVDPAQ